MWHWTQLYKEMSSWRESAGSLIQLVLKMGQHILSAVLYIHSAIKNDWQDVICILCTWKMYISGDKSFLFREPRVLVSWSQVIVSKHMLYTCILADLATNSTGPVFQCLWAKQIYQWQSYKTECIYVSPDLGSSEKEVGTIRVKRVEAYIIMQEWYSNKEHACQSRERT